jgi:hypothetical protein
LTGDTAKGRGAFHDIKSSIAGEGGELCPENNSPTPLGGFVFIFDFSYLTAAIVSTIAATRSIETLMNEII